LFCYNKSITERFGNPEPGQAFSLLTARKEVFMEPAKKRKLITRIYLTVAALLLVATVILCVALCADTMRPNEDGSTNALAALAVVLLVIIFVIGGVALQIILCEIFILVRYLMTDPRKRTAYTACNITSAAIAVLLPVAVLLLNVLQFDPDGTLSLLILLFWGAAWVLFRGVYLVLRQLQKKNTPSEF
jgi:hypothetical protein